MYKITTLSSRKKSYPNDKSAMLLIATQSVRDLSVSVILVSKKLQSRWLSGVEVPGSPKYRQYYWMSNFQRSWNNN